MIRLALKGNTYGIKETLKDLEFKWNQQEKAWIKDFEDSEEKEANELSTRWIIEGVYGTINRGV